MSRGNSSGGITLHRYRCTQNVTGWWAYAGGI